MDASWREDPDRWAGWDIPCDGVIRRLLPALVPGPALHVALAQHQPLLWLAGAGFVVESVTATLGPVVERLSGPLDTGPGGPDAAGGMELPPGQYALVILDGVLSFLGSRRGDRLMGAAKRTVRPGGLIYVAAYAASDPARAWASAGPETGDAARARPCRFMAAGELAMAFEGWMLLHVTHGPLVDAGGMTRSASVVAARRPSGSALLA
jgi:hypothetical protein